MYKIKKSKLIFFYKAFLLLFLVCGSCSKDDSPAQDILPSEGNRIKSLKGESLGIGVTKNIGKDGGVIELSSEGISVTIPAGAVQQETNFGIEMIANTNPAAVGAGYRLTPSSITLLKPVTISLSMEKIKDEVSVSDALAFACQTTEGFWNMLDSKKTNNLSGYLTATTKHLGDFGPMQWLFLQPVNSAVAVNQSAQIEALRYIDLPGGDDFLAVPLVSQNEFLERPVLNPVALEARYIKKWELQGTGTLTPQGSKAIYQASALPGGSATVKVELNTKNDKVLLVSDLIITKDQYLKIKVNDRPVINLIVTEANVNTDQKIFSISGGLPNYDINKIGFAFGGKAIKGSYAWDNDYIDGNSDTDAFLSYIAPSGKYYVQWFESGSGLPYLASPGSLDITEAGAVGGYLIGKFTATSAGMYTNDLIYSGTSRIEGEFKVLISDNRRYSKNKTRQ